MGKKDFLYRLILMAVMLSAYSCMSDISKEDLDPNVSKGEEISIQVSMPQNEQESASTRVAFNDNSLELTWEDGDKLAIIGYNSSGSIVGKEVLNLQSRNSNTAKFVGRSVNGATHYDVYYPAEAVQNNGTIHINYDQQAQSGNNNTAHLKNYILLKQEGAKLTTEEVLLKKRNIPMQMQNAIIKFDLNNIFIDKPVALKWEIEETGGNKTVKELAIQNLSNDLHETFTGFLCVPDFKVSAKSITVSLLGKKDDNSPYQPMNYHIDLNKELTYATNHRYTALIEKGWIYKIYYKSNLNINESFKNDNSLKDKIYKEEYNDGTNWGYVDLKQEDDVALKNLRIPSIKQNIEYLDIYGICGIAPKAFTGCSKLNSIVLHAGVNSIGVHAFEGCKQLKTVKLNNDLKTIENNAFHNCEGLEQITIPESVTTIEQSAFAQCTTLKSIKTPNGVKCINKNTFEGCNALSNVILNEGLETIDQNAFNNCTALTSITIPNSVTTIGSSAFAQCITLKSIKIPNGVKCINKNTFEGCNALSNVILNEGLETIDELAFYNCTALTSITIPNSVTTIGSSAFTYSGLTSCTFPSNVTSIGSKTFVGCLSLTEITVSSTTPPTITGSGNNKNLLGFEYPSKIKIYVPAGSVDRYKTAEGWNAYKDRIFPIQ